MSKKSTKALASATLMSLVLTTALTAGPVKAAAGKVTRTSGADRYQTAAQVATTNWKDGSNDVVLVSGEGYADAVSASALAKKLNAPILLTTAGSLSTDTKSALTSLKAKNIYVVGGEASVSSSVRSELKKDYSLIELGGSTRYETNAAVAQKLVDLGVKADEVIMVGGEGFSDALSVAPVAAAKGQILLLGMNDAKHIQSVLDFVNKNNSKVTVVGTKNVINDSILNTVKGTRIDGGSSRFDTNIKVLTAFKDTLKMDKLYVASAQVNAADNGYADALVASALAGKVAAPLVLVDKDSSDATATALKYIKENAKSTTDLNIIGGTGVVSQSIEDKINGVPTNPDTNHTVQSIEDVNLNEIKIHFNGTIDSDSAEDVTNYKVDGVQLTQVDANNKAVDSSSAVAHAIDDNTVSIVLAKARKHKDKVEVGVKKGVYTKDMSNVFDEYTNTVLFDDGDAPTIKKVSMEGNSQLTVEFSEAINMKNINELKNKFKIDGQSLGNVNTTYSKIKNCIVVPEGIDGTVGTWAYKVMFYFDSQVKSGDHTLKVNDGDLNGALCDAAGYIFQESTENFTVDQMSTKPEVKSIKETSPGEVHVTFDRPMDVQTAEDPSYWELNKTNLSKMSGVSFDTDDNDATIKIKGLGKNIQTGSNVMYIKNNIKDAFGNKVPDDTRPYFDELKDDTKPTVLDASKIDSETISVKFNKPVDYKFATSISNYKLFDNKDVDVTSHIDKIVSYKGEGNTEDTTTYKIKMKRNNPKDASDDWRLVNSKYTLKVMNIKDTSSTGHVMDDWAHEITGKSDIAPTGVAMYNKSRIKANSSKDSVVIYFSTPMDESTLGTKANYQFINGKGDPKPLPSDASISYGGDGKSAIVEFPTSYHVQTTGKNKTTGKEYDVLALSVSNVKDEAGNALSGFAFDNGGIISEAKQGASVKDNTIKTKYDSDDLKVQVQFTREIEQANASDFTLGGVTPSSVDKDGDLVTLTFKDGMAATADDIKNAASPVTYANGTNTSPTKIELVKSQGQKAKLAVKATSTIDVSGALVSTNDDGITPATLATTQSTIYDAQAAPRTTCFNNHDDYPKFWTATKDNTGGKVYITFDAPLDSNSGVQEEDITFTGYGTTIKADHVAVDADHPNTLVFRFDTTNKDYASFTGDLDVNIKSSIKLISPKDADGNHSTYTPTADDLSIRPIKIVDTTTTNKFAVDSIKESTLVPGAYEVIVSLDTDKYTITADNQESTTTYGSGKAVLTIKGTNLTKDSVVSMLHVSDKVAPTPTAQYTVDSIKESTLVPGAYEVIVSFDTNKYTVTADNQESTTTYGSGKAVLTIKGANLTQDSVKTLLHFVAK